MENRGFRRLPRYNDVRFRTTSKSAFLTHPFGNAGPMRMREALLFGIVVLLATAGAAEAVGQTAFKPVVAGAVSPELYAAPGSRPPVGGAVSLDAVTPEPVRTPVPDVPRPEEASHESARTLPFPPIFGAPMDIPASDVQAGAQLSAPSGGRPWILPLVGLVATAAAVAVASTRTRRALILAPPVERTRTVPVLAPVGPDDIFGLLQNGNIAAQRGDLDEATAWFRQAASVAPTLAVAHFCHGTCLWGSGRHESAMRAYSRAVDLDPSDGAARIQLARVQLALGEVNDAMVVLAPVLRDVPAFLPVMQSDPDFAALADHPRFLAMAGVL